MKWDLPDLQSELRRLLQQVPCGQVTTYGDLADALGHRSAARWVGEFMVDHRHDESCPCHRVVRGTGKPGLYISRRERDKVCRLQAEGVELTNGRVDLGEYGFRSFKTTRPLKDLVEWQRHIPESVRFRPLDEVPQMVAGMDVAYPERHRAVGAYALVETETGRLKWSATIDREVTFPYIPGFLTFREVPLLLQLLEEAARQGHKAPLVFIDGNGLLHPRRAGIATCFGVLADVAAVGIGKKLLIGSVDLHDMDEGEPRPVVHEGEVIGMAVKAGQRSRPVFVSPGQHIDVPGAVRAAVRLMHGHRVPEPIYHADAICRKAARNNREPKQA